MSAQPQGKSVLRHLLPWSSQVLWWVVLVEGIVLAGFGLFMVIMPQAGFITITVAIYLLVEGILTLIRVLRQSPLDRSATAQLMRGTASLAVGLVIFVPRVLVSLIVTASAQARQLNPVVALDPTTFRLFLAVAATGVSLVGILRFWEASQQRTNERRIGSALVGLIMVGLAVIGFASAVGGLNTGFSIGLFALFLGAILIIYAIILRLRARSGGRHQGESSRADTTHDSYMQDEPVDQSETGVVSGS